MLLFEWSDTLLIVEAKFISPTDPEELLREYLIGQFEAMPDKNAFLLLVDKNLSLSSVNHYAKPGKVTVAEYLQSRIDELYLSEKYETEKVASTILWINWQTFYSMVEKLKDEVLPDLKDTFGTVIEKILEDLLAILKRKGLEPFENLDLTEFDQYKVKLNSLDIFGRMLNDPVPFLSKFDLHHKTLFALLQPKD